jgi:hypothetical protein
MSSTMLAMTSSGTPSMLIRPDGYLAWDDSGDQTLRSALTRWFGPPLPHA